MDPRRLTILPEPLKNFVLGSLDPVADFAIRAGLQPNGITTLSLFVVLASSAAIALGDLRWGAALLLASGGFDMLDGKVARRGNMSSKFGAFYDSTLDRLGEALLFTGIAVYFVSTGGQRWPVLGLLLCFGTLSFSFSVSYARARAEGLGLEATVGITQRAERIVLIGVPTLIWHAGPHGILLLIILSFLCLTSGITVVQRIMHVYKLTHLAPENAPRPASAPAPAMTAAAMKAT